MQRMIYPETNAYRSETGGVMSALRDLTVEQSASPPASRLASLAGVEHLR